MESSVEVKLEFARCGTGDSERFDEKCECNVWLKLGASC